MESEVGGMDTGQLPGWMLGVRFDAGGEANAAGIRIDV